jgi:hypothetical protein
LGLQLLLLKDRRLREKEGDEELREEEEAEEAGGTRCF